MIKQFNQSAAYICPVCSAVTCRHLNVFDFSGAKAVRLMCGVKRCGEEVGSIREEKDGYKISLDCPFCGYVHDFNLKKASFWKRDFFVLKCPVSDIELFIIGNIDLVKEEIKKQQRLLSEMAADDEQMLVLFDLMTVVNELSNNGRITCECGCDKVEIDIRDNKIVITCAKCGALIELEPTEEEYERILFLKEIKIHKND